MLDIVICDDDAVQAKYTARIVNRALGGMPHDTEIFSSPQRLLDKVTAGRYSPDIAVLDIAMDELDGIGLAERLNALAPRCRIIFLTGYLDYATDVYAAEHSYFILKTELETRIGAALEKALASLNLGESRLPSLVIKIRGAATPVSVATVEYIERVGRRTRVKTQQGEYMTAQPVTELVTDELAGHFIHCHQSFWVRPEAVHSMESNEFLMKSGDAVPISRSAKKEVREAFFAYLTR